MKKIKAFTNWSFVFLGITLAWLIFQQNKKADGYGANMLPIIIAVAIMAHYERRIRFQLKDSPPKNPN
jgi:hypothetical protein